MEKNIFHNLDKSKIFDIKSAIITLIIEVIVVTTFIVFHILTNIASSNEIITYFSKSNLLEIMINGFILYAIIYVIFSERRQKIVEKQMYESVFKHNLHPAFMINERGRITKINDAAEKIYGYRKEEIMGLDYKIFLPPEEAVKSQKVINQVLKGTAQKQETKIYHKSGYEIDVEFNAIPIVVANKVVGVVGFIKDISEEKRSKKSLENANKHLKEISELDGLIGIKNRGFFEKEIKEQWDNALMDGRNLSLILLDVDFFKTYNDTYGHIIGDKCLKQVTEAVSKAIRKDWDTLCRYGGEEFIVILPETDCCDAYVIGERVRSSVENLKIPHIKSEASNFVTVSVGVSNTIPKEGESYEDLISRADEAMYMAKKNGRNKVTLLK